MEKCIAVTHLFMLTVIVLTRCEEEDFMADISAKETNLWISIGGKTFPNPCKSSTCPSGEKCTIQYVPRLLKMPIAHCIESTATLNDGICQEYTIGTNILHCKSEAEWNDISIIQCHLRSKENVKFVSTKVQHLCPDITRTGGMKFLTASFNCCMENSHTSEDIIASTDTALNIHHSYEVEPQRHSLWSILIGSGATLLSILLLVLATIIFRCRHSKKSKCPSPPPVKTLINPDAYLDYNDKTLLIIEE